MPRKRTPLGRAFGRVLKAIRKEHGLTQDELADRVDYSRVQIGYFETGVSTPSLEALIRLERELKLPPGDLVRRTLDALPRR